MSKKFLLFISLMFMTVFLVISIYIENDKLSNLDIENYVDNLSFILKGKMDETINCFFNESDEGYYLFLPSYASMENVEVHFQGADYMEFSDEENSAIIKRGEKLSSLKTNIDYECAFVRDGEKLQNMTLSILQSANIPTVFIETKTGTMESVDSDKNYQEKGNFALISEGGKVEWVSDLDHITGRGNDTWYRPKKSYGIKLSSAADLLGMGAADHWILLCNVVDDIYIRNKVVYDMAVEAGMEGAPESQFVDLYINHEYHGMYQLSEKIEIDEERIPIDNLEIENKKINKNYKLAERFGDDCCKGVKLEITPKDITGGYLIERDVYTKYSEEISGFQSTASQEYYTIKSPEYASEDEVTYIRNLFSEMETAVQAEDGINPNTQKSYLEYIDLKSFAQKYIIEEMSKNYGGGASSSFFYKPKDSMSQKIFAGPVWDYDKAYGLVPGYNSNTRDLGYLTLRAEGTTLFEELYKHVEFRNMVSMCWKEFFSGYLEEVYADKIDIYYTEIEESVRMDRIRWSACFGIYDWEKENKERIEFLKKFIAERKKFLDEVWVKNAEICVVTFEENVNDIHTSLGVIKGETVIPVYSDDIRTMPLGMELEGWYNVETGELFDEHRPIEKNITLRGLLKKREEAE